MIMVNKDKEKLIDQETLKQLFFYDPSTGLFARKSGKSKVGSLEGNGYIDIKIGSFRYKAHRLAWLYVYGHFPKNFIDHINRDKTDNRIENLRDVSHRVNAMNRGVMSNNKSGYPGVSWDKTRKKWRCYVTLNKIPKTIGRFNSIEEAVEARECYLNQTER